MLLIRGQLASASSHRLSFPLILVMSEVLPGRVFAAIIVVFAARKEISNCSYRDIYALLLCSFGCIYFYSLAPTANHSVEVKEQKQQCSMGVSRADGILKFLLEIMPKCYQ